MGAGTPSYKAPELFDDGPPGIDGAPTEPEFTPKCDVYAFGICVWELITGDVPWKGKTESSLLRALMRDERPPLSGSQEDTFLGNVAKRSWSEDPDRRPTFVQLQREISVLAPPSNAARQLLIFACSPSVSPLPEVGSEAVQVMLATSWGEACSTHWGGSAQSLRDALEHRRTRCLLFSGHADAPSPGDASLPAKTLGFTKPGGEMEMHPPERVAELLGAFASSLEIVFLNGCRSLELGRMLRGHEIKTVVCWSTVCLDKGACLFASAFFTAIARDQSARSAFTLAKEEVRLATRPGLSNGLQGQVTAYEFRAPDQPSAFQCAPKPKAVGVPVLLSAEGEYYD